MGGGDREGQNTLLCISYLQGYGIEGHSSSLADSFGAYQFTKVRILQKNIVYSFQGLISSNVSMQSSMCLRSPVKISV